jgi:hypothetical protein
MKWRISVLCFIVSLLAILGLGEIQEFGDGIKYPAQAGVNLTKYEGNLTKKQIRNKLEQLTKANNLVLFKPILQSNGSQKVFIFGNGQNYLKNKMYSDDKRLLDDTEMTGMYYSDKKISNNLINELETMGFKYKAGDIAWWMVPVNFFLGRNVRSIAVWTLLFVFAVLLFAVKMMYVKTTMVQRSLGMLRATIIKDIVLDIGILILDVIIIVTFFILWQGSFSSVFVKSFNLLLSVILLSLIVIALIVNGLFALNVRLMPAIKVLKNKKSQGIVSYIWLIGILASVFIFNITANEIIHESFELSKKAKMLQGWEVAKDFAKISWFSREEEHMNKDHQIDGQFMLDNGRKNKYFIQAFGEKNWLYSKETSLDKRMLEVDSFAQKLNQAGVDISLAKAIHYVNEGMVAKNKQIYPNNNYGKLSATDKSSPVIIYVPQKHQKSINKIKNIVNFEHFQYTAVNANLAPVIIVPNQQTTFLFKHIEGENELFAGQTEKDKILVQLNFSKFPDDNALTTNFEIIAFDGLFKQKLVKQNLQSAGLEDTFSSLTNAASDVLMKRNTIINRLIGATIALISLTIAQVFVLYQYIKLQIELRSKQITIKNILGKPAIVELIKILALLVGGLAIASEFAYFVTNNKVVIVSVSSMYLIEISLLTVISLLTIKRKRVQIMKGDFEIL